MALTGRSKNEHPEQSFPIFKEGRGWQEMLEEALAPSSKI